MSDIFELPNTNDATLEEILDNTDNKRIFLSSDWHIMKYKYTKERNPVNTTEIVKWCKNNIKSNDVFIYLGDLAYRYANQHDSDEIKEIYKSLPGIKVLILGNHDIMQGEEFYKDCGFDYIFNEFLYKNILFSHRPVDMILRGYVTGLNIHGHIHNLSNDYDFLNPDRNINVYPANYNNKPVTLDYILNHVNKLTKDNSPNGRTDGLTESAELIRNFIQNNIKPVQETKRSEIPDNEFGIPQERKYPLDTESHVRSAVKMFNYVEPKYEEQLARAVIKKMKKFDIKDMKISKENRLYKYINESSLTDTKQCKYCGSNNIIKIETMFYGQQAYKCVDCNEILGTVPDSITEVTSLIRSLTEQLYDFTEETEMSEKLEKYDLKGTRTEQCLKAAFAEESGARNKYTYYAAKAKKDGYNQIGNIFTETANNEREHAKIWFKLLHDGDIPDTEENLKDAIEGEHYEWIEMYKKFAKVAREEGFDDIAKTFEMVGEIEKAHGMRYAKLLENIEDGIVFSRDGDKIWKCGNCGHIHIGKEAPEECSVCSHPQKFFELLSENY